MDNRLYHVIPDHAKRIERLEQCVDEIRTDIGKLSGAASTTLLLVKWVITPMLVILGGLVGIKLLWPGL